jgi:hypothetical protein
VNDSKPVGIGGRYTSELWVNVEAKIGMNVDVPVKLLSKSECRIDVAAHLCGRIEDAQVTAKQICPHADGLVQQHEHSLITAETFLWKGDELQVYNISEVLLELEQGFHALQPYDRIDINV